MTLTTAEAITNVRAGFHAKRLARTQAPEMLGSVMKYTTRHTTYSSNDCTSTGWLVESNASRARLTKRTRWQGSRNDIVVTCKIDEPLTEESARALAEKLDHASACSVLSLRRGDSAWGLTVQSTGYIVR